MFSFFYSPKADESENRKRAAELSDCRRIKQPLNRPGSEQKTCRRRTEADTARAVPPVLRIADDSARCFRGIKDGLFNETALF